MADMITWQEAVRDATKMAHRAWKAAGLPGPHAVRVDCVTQTPTHWVLVHGRADDMRGPNDAEPVMDPPAIVVDRETGEASVLTYLDVDLSEAERVGEYPDWLWD